MKRPTPLLFAPLLAVAVSIALVGQVSAGPFATRQREQARVEAAWRAQHAAVAADFRSAGAAWPPRGLFLRAFKAEGELEVWASPPRGERRVLVKAIPICATSGGLGPKTQRGDFQVPEGFYRLDRFNPWSSYHLSLGLSYPNAYDRARARARGRRVSPGGDIFIHGRCVTVGCVPIEDGPIEWLYLAALEARDAGQRRIPAHLFPCRFGRERCEAALAQRAADFPELTAFWATLAEGYRAFEATRQPPRVRVTRGGYALTPVGEPLASPR